MLCCHPKKVTKPPQKSHKKSHKNSYRKIDSVYTILYSKMDKKWALVFRRVLAKKSTKICLKKSQKILNLTQIIRTLDVPALTEIPPKTPPPCPLYIVVWPLNVLVHKTWLPQKPSLHIWKSEERINFHTTYCLFQPPKKHTVRYFVR